MHKPTYETDLATREARYETLFTTTLEDGTPWLAFWGFEIGAGWAALVSDMLAEIEAQNIDVTICNIREKWGRLDVLYWTQDADIEPIIDRAEKRAAQTCKLCGNSPRFDHPIDWELCLCKPCWNSWPTKSKVPLPGAD